MSSFYDTLGQTAEKLLAKYGSTVTLTRAVDTFTPGSGQTARVSTSYQGIGVIESINQTRPTPNSVLTTDKVAWVRISGIEPSSGDSLTVQGTVYQVVSVSIIKPGNTFVIAQCVVRI